MKLSYQWLSEYVNLGELTPDALAEKLTSVGLAVDAVVPRNQGVTGVVVGEVVTCEQHPNADRLRVCEVNVGQGELYTIVCGAANVTAGQKVPVALPGATLPGGVTIKQAKLRGVESNGMLCSAKELGLETKLLPSHQTSGLFILPCETPVGADIVSLLALDDVVLEVDLTPNRSDCLSMRGFAYEVAAILGTTTTFPENIDLQNPDVETVQPVRVRIETEKCTRYEAQVLDSVASVESPLWMQMRLIAMGVRPIDLIVDVTNYVMLEWGQPLHAFDLAEVHEQTIVVRQAYENEIIVTLDGEERELNPEMMVIADVDRAIGIAGVMGGENSEITTNTTKIVLESAAFHAATTRRTGQRLGLRSEAQQRFEKGVDPVAVRGALRRATSLLQKLAGAKRIGDIVGVGVNVSAEEVSREVQFSPNRCNQLLGTSIKTQDMLTIFHRLGFTVQTSNSDAPWRVLVPSRRPDITIEADLVEEVGRLYGFDAVPSTLPFGPTTAGRRNGAQTLRKRTREILIGAGMTEVVTYAFSHPDALAALRLPESSPYYQMIPLLKPLSDERVALRTHLLPSLAEVAKHNLSHSVPGGRIFEIARVYWPKELPLTEQPCERTQCAALWFGQTEPVFGQKSRGYDFYDAKGIVEEWVSALGWSHRIEYRRREVSWLHPGRSVEVLLDGQRIGTFGELHPETAAAFDIGIAIYAEFDLDLLADEQTGRWLIQPLPKYPAARRDLALLVNQDVLSGDLIQTAMSDETARQILQNCFVFDVYQGTGIPEGKKSIALAFIYQAEDRTLTDEEIEDVQSRIMERFRLSFDAELRM